MVESRMDRPLIYHPTASAETPAWLEQHYSTSARAFFDPNSTTWRVLGDPAACNVQIICVEPYFLPRPIVQTPKSIFVWVGDFHHLNASITGLLAYLHDLISSGFHVLFASSCQPWLNVLVEALFGINTLAYLELDYEVNAVEGSVREGIRLGAFLRTFGTRDLNVYQPKRSVYLNNQLRLGVDLETCFHPRLAKRQWLGLLLHQSSYVVPTISGQVSPQVSYPLLFGLQLCSDVPIQLLRHLFLEQLGLDEAILQQVHALTGDCRQSPEGSELTLSQKQSRYADLKSRVLNDPSFWVPGQAFDPEAFRSASPPGTGAARFETMSYLLWVFDLLIVLSQRFYIRSLSVDGSVRCPFTAFYPLFWRFFVHNVEPMHGLQSISVELSFSSDLVLKLVIDGSPVVVSAANHRHWLDRWIAADQQFKRRVVRARPVIPAS